MRGMIEEPRDAQVEPGEGGREGWEARLQSRAWARPCGAVPRTQVLILRVLGGKGMA